MSRVIVLLLACLMVASPAFADDEDARVRAEARWKQGKAFYDAGQWDQAIVEFRAAWEITKEPDLVFGIGLALQKKGELKAALAEFRRYLELAPNGEAASEARELVVTLTPKVEALEADAAREAKRTQDEAEAKRQADERARVQREQALAASARRSRILRWSGLSGVVAGGVLVGLGVKFGVDARAAADELTDHTEGAWTEALLARQDDGRSANRRFIAVTAIGGAVVVAGVVTYVLGRRTRDEGTLARRWTLEPLDRGAAVAFGGRF